MKIFVSAQGSGLRVMHGMVRRLEQRGEVERAAYYVADRRYFHGYVAAEAGLGSDTTILKEWELVARGRLRRPSAEEISAWESRLGVGSLWPALMSDRRMVYGRLSKVKQAYRPGRSLEELQGIVVELLEQLWGHFERFEPDAVVGFIPVTIGDYLVHLIARALEIPYLHVKSTKIANFVTLTTDIAEGHPHIRRRYLAYRRDPLLAGEFMRRAEEYLSAIEGKPIVYEGAQQRRAGSGAARSLLGFGRHAPGAAFQALRQRLSQRDEDPQTIPPFGGLWERQVGRQVRVRAAERITRSSTLHPDELHRTPYVFFPLNSEPEIALSIYGRFTLNQIEAVRNVAQSVPLGTLVLVKDHPRSWGLRSSGYYRRLLEIPNVRFLDPAVPTAVAIEHSAATVVISGFAGFEAIMQRIPVLTLGNTSFEMLPDQMVRHVASWPDFEAAYRQLLQNYAWDRDAIRAYIAAFMSSSIPLDLYTRLLRKPGREQGTGAVANRGDVEDQLDLLASYFLRRFREESMLLATPERAADQGAPAIA